MNTAVDADDGNPVLREHVAKALRCWLGSLQVIAKEAAGRGELAAGVEPKTVATVIVAALEGAFMMSRVERNSDALRQVQEHLFAYIDSIAAAPRGPADAGVETF